MRIPDLLTARFFLVAILICVAFWVAPAQAQSDVGPKASTGVTPIANADRNSSICPAANSNEIEGMKADLARQQKEILDLQTTVDRQQKLIEQLLHFSATTKPVEESTATIIQPAATTLQPTGPAAVGPPPAESSAVEPIRKVKDTKQNNGSPLTFRPGNIYLTPAGFFDFTAFIRDRNVGSGLATNFGGIPIANTPAGNLSETRFSAQNSRIALRLDTRFRGSDVLGYLETDFNGFAPSNVAVTTNSYTRTFWRDRSYGTLQFITQYSYVVRHPWSVAAGDPSGAHVNMVYLDLRYLFPGAPPVLKQVKRR